MTPWSRQSGFAENKENYSLMCLSIGTMFIQVPTCPSLSLLEQTFSTTMLHEKRDCWRNRVQENVLCPILVRSPRQRFRNPLGDLRILSSTISGCSPYWLHWGSIEGIGLWHRVASPNNWQIRLHTIMLRWCMLVVALPSTTIPSLRISYFGPDQAILYESLIDFFVLLIIESFTCYSHALSLHR